jgi:hypothetical protein
MLPLVVGAAQRRQSNTWQADSHVRWSLQLLQSSRLRRLHELRPWTHSYSTSSNSISICVQTNSKVGGGHIYLISKSILHYSNAVLRHSDRRGTHWRRSHAASLPIWVEQYERGPARVNNLQPSRLCTVMYCYVLLCTAMYCYVLLCTAMYCYVLLCTAMYCYVLLCTVMWRTLYFWQEYNIHHSTAWLESNGQLTTTPSSCVVLR